MVPSAAIIRKGSKASNLLGRNGQTNNRPSLIKDYVSDIEINGTLGTDVPNS